MGGQLRARVGQQVASQLFEMIFFKGTRKQIDLGPSDRLWLKPWRQIGGSPQKAVDPRIADLRPASDLDPVDSVMVGRCSHDGRFWLVHRHAQCSDTRS